MLLIQAAGQGSQFDADKFAYRSQAFLNIIQHMLAENIWPNEKKIELVKTIYRQIVRFRNSIPVYKVMQGANVCFSEAAAAIQIAKNDTVSDHKSYLLNITHYVLRIWLLSCF